MASTTINAALYNDYNFDEHRSVNIFKAQRSPRHLVAAMPKPRVIYWFRTDLRLHDSPALKAALDLKPECLYPIWCWDPHYVYRARVGVNRWQYL